MEKFPIAFVEWLDASHYDGSESIKWLREEGSLMETTTIGFIIKAGRKNIIVAHEVNGASRARNTSIIARKDIKTITYLKPIKG